MKKSMMMLLVLLVVNIGVNAKTREPNQVPEPTLPGDVDLNTIAKKIYKNKFVSMVEAAGIKGYGFPVKAAKKEGAIREVSDLDCSKNPAPYGSKNTDMCQITMTKTLGFYADPYLRIDVEAFVNKNKLKVLQDSDIQIRAVTVIQPDRSGLE